jgi:hypothetical protein
MEIVDFTGLETKTSLPFSVFLVNLHTKTDSHVGMAADRIDSLFVNPKTRYVLHGTYH